MEVRKAVSADIDELVALRLAFLNEQNGEMDQTVAAAIAERSRDFFERRLPRNDLVAMFGEENGVVLSTAFLLVSEKPANPDFPNGLVGTILNVYTLPDHRGKGHSTKVMAALVEEGRKMGLAALDLLATHEGKGLYEKLGFTVSGYSSMRLFLADNS